MDCVNCGNQLRLGAVFCDRCGARLTPQAEAGASGPASDSDLAARMRMGDEEAFTALYRRYVGPIYDFVARIVRAPALAEDVTQAAFIQVWEERATLRSPEAVRSWIYRIAQRLAIGQVSRAPVTVDVEDQLQLAAVEAGPEERAMAAEAARLVWDAAASLEPQQAAILDLSLRRGLRTSEIGEILEVDTARASLLVNRAREALGNAVRYLLVARRRSHCERLAQLVPAGVSQLTSEQRATVDHHMRRCPVCQGTALRLTAPEELFGALLLLPLPTRLAAPPQALRHAALTVAQTVAGSAHQPPPPPPQASSPSVVLPPSAPLRVGGGAERALYHLSRLRLAVAGVVALALAGGIAFGVTRIAHGSPAAAAPLSNGIANKTPAQILKAASDAAGGANGYHVTATISAGTDAASMNLDFTRPASGGSRVAGTLSEGGGVPVDIVGIETGSATTWFYNAPSSATWFWTQLNAADSPRQLAGHWFTGKALSSLPSATLGFLDLLRALGTLTSNGTGAVDGQPVVFVRNVAKATCDDFMWAIATTGTPYPVRVSVNQSTCPSAGEVAETGTITFSHWNAISAITPPPDAITGSST